MDESRTWAEIRLDNLEHNMRAILTALPVGTKFLGVVKADAYGHGAIPVARRLEKAGADYLAVACLQEAKELRNADISLPILILGRTSPEQVPALLEGNFTQALTGTADAQAYDEAASAVGGELRVHIKLDTGMHRLGFPNGDIEAIAAACQRDHLLPEGIFTHFAASDMPEDEPATAYTRMQFRRFLDTVEELARRGIHFSLRHAANTGATAYYPETALDMVRPGIALYGYGDGGRFGLRPVMRLMSRIAAVNFFPPGTKISYGGIYETVRPTRVGVIPVGYADGLHRGLSNRCAFALPGGMVPQIGRICMDMCMIDLTDRPEADAGAVVEVFGDNANLDVLSERAGTIPYELLCGVSRRVPRIYC